MATDLTKKVSNSIPSRTGKTFKRLNSNTQSYTEQNNFKPKQLSIRKNDSSQLLTALSNASLEPREVKVNVKNQSNIIPSSESMTCLPFAAGKVKPIRKTCLLEKPNRYKAYLTEIEPEYLDSDSRSKSWQHMKIIHRKYSLRTKPQSLQTSKKCIISPLKLCNDGEFSRQFIEAVKPRRKAQSLISCSLEEISSRLTCDAKSKLSSCSRSRNTKETNACCTLYSGNVSEVSETDSKSVGSIQDFDCTSDYCYNEQYDNCYSQSKWQTYIDSLHKTNLKCNSNDKIHTCTYVRPIKCQGSHFDLDRHDFKNHHNKRRTGDSCRLHSIIQFRSENYDQTHASPPQSSEPQYQTYILDKRLFPVPIESNKENMRPNRAYSTNVGGRLPFKPPNNVNFSKHSKPPSGNIKNIESNIGETSKTGFRRPVPADSLALRHQKGITR